MNTHTKTFESTISAKGQTTVPVEIRKRYGCTVGTRLLWHLLADGRVMVRVKNKSLLDPAGM